MERARSWKKPEHILWIDDGDGAGKSGGGGGGGEMCGWHEIAARGQSQFALRLPREFLVSSANFVTCFLSMSDLYWKRQESRRQRFLGMRK